MMNTLRNNLISAFDESRLDSFLSSINSFDKAVETKLSPLLPKSSPVADHYIRSFPQHALLASADVSLEDDFLLAPTTCYAVFDSLQGARISSPSLFTHKNICFRNEQFYARGERQAAFTMREYIFLSSDLIDVRRWIDRVINDLRNAFIDNFDVQLDVVKASDPFFDPQDFHLKFQEAQDLKHEFVVDGLAVGSVNLHLQAFTRGCNMRALDGGTLYSACFGLGYDRVVSKLAEMTRGVAPAKEE